MGKFQATIQFPVLSPEDTELHQESKTQYNLEDCDIKIDCPELRKWYYESQKLFGLLESPKKIHLFEEYGDAFAICDAVCRKYWNKPSFFVWGGRKYTVCLKCRKIAQGEES